MTEEIIKECKNCDALGIDSEIGVYYCCLSHRQDDLPKEFTCDDFTPNKQLMRLEQECNEWKKKYEDVANENLKEIYELIKKNDCWRGVVNVVCSKLEQENKELRERFEKRGELMCNCAKQRENYRSAFKEIRKIAAPRFVNSLNEEADLCNLAMDRIQNKINEVLNDSEG